MRWDQYDAIYLACGFEERSVSILPLIPAAHWSKCFVLGFRDNRNTLSRVVNDAAYAGVGVNPFIGKSADDYEEFLRQSLYAKSRSVTNRPFRILVDYSAMTRAWYAYISTWMMHSQDVAAADVDFVYVHGAYNGQFENLQIDDFCAIAGFEGRSAGSRRTFSLYGLGYDKYATLAVHEIIQPDRFWCLVAADPISPHPAQRVIRENAEIIDMSGHQPILVPLSDISAIVTKIAELVAAVPDSDEIIAVPMGPKTHVLATLLAGHRFPQLQCMHARGRRLNPVQVQDAGRIGCCRVEYR